LMVESEEVDSALVAWDIWWMVTILVLQQAKERVEAKPVNQDIVVEVEMQILMGVVALCWIVVYTLQRFEARVALIRWKCRGGG
jgi:hypothetical protein